MNKLDEMWTALEAHKPAPSYAEAWQMMIKERTREAARAAARAASAAAARAAAASAADAAWAAAWAAARADRAARIKPLR